MLQNCKTAEEMKALSLTGQQVLQSVEDSPKPVVAAIMGACLGGGLEVSVTFRTMGLFTSTGIDRLKSPTSFSVPSERHGQNGANKIVQALK